MTKSTKKSKSEPDVLTVEEARARLRIAKTRSTTPWPARRSPVSGSVGSTSCRVSPLKPCYAARPRRPARRPLKQPPRVADALGKHRALPKNNPAGAGLPLPQEKGR